MKKLLNAAIFLAVLSGVAAVAYNVLLNEKARTSLKGSIDSVKGIYEQITDALDDAKGIVMEEEELPNRVATRLQWEALGY